MPRGIRAKKTPRKELKEMRKKQLINLPEDQKDFIGAVVRLAEQSGLETTQTEIIRILVGREMARGPEAFVAQLKKLQLKARYDDLERREAELKAEKETLAAELGTNQRSGRSTEPVVA